MVRDAALRAALTMRGGDRCSEPPAKPILRSIAQSDLAAQRVDKIAPLSAKS
jgi:hypothetical protein